MKLLSCEFCSEQIVFLLLWSNDSSSLMFFSVRLLTFSSSYLRWTERGVIAGSVSTKVVGIRTGSATNVSSGSFVLVSGSAFSITIFLVGSRNSIWLFWSSSVCWSSLLALGPWPAESSSLDELLFYYRPVSFRLFNYFSSVCWWWLELLLESDYSDVNSSSSVRISSRGISSRLSFVLRRV